MQKVIYLYTTIAERHKRYKLGETTPHPGEDLESAAQRRLDGQKTANPDSLILVRWWDSHMGDKKIHNALKRSGYEYCDGGDEWFQVGTITEEELLHKINEIIKGTKRMDTFKPRAEQQACIDKACMAFSTGHKEFLLDAKMRFGKTFTAFKIMEAAHFDKVLVLTYTPYVKKEWIAPIEHHVDFEGWKIIDAIKHAERIELGKGRPVVVFTSAQDLLKAEGKERWGALLQESWDLVIFDEFDFGGLTENAETMLTDIKTKHFLYLTGTSFKVLACKKFKDVNCYKWTYEDEVRAKIQEQKEQPSKEIYKWLPKLSYVHIEIGRLGVDVTKAHYTDMESKFSFVKFFEVKDDKFVHKKAIEGFLHNLVGYGIPESPYNKLDLRHSLWLLPTIEAVNKMESLIMEHYDTDFCTAAISGKDNNLALTAVDQALHNVKKKRSITLTCQKYIRGMTFAKWDSVFFLRSIDSPKEYFQAAFRAQSENKPDGKKDCYVIDMDLSRILRLAHIRSLHLTEFKLDESKVHLKNYFECAPLLQYKDNRFQETDFESIWRRVKDGLNLETLLRDDNLHRMVNLINISENMVDMLKDLASGTSLKNITQGSLDKVVVLNDTQGDLKGSESLNLIQGEDGAEPEVKRTLEDLRIICKDLIKDILKYTLVTQVSEKSIDDILAGDSLLFKEFTGITMEEFRSLLANNVIHSELLNEAIFGYFETEQEILNTNLKDLQT